MNGLNRRCPETGSAVVEHGLLVAFVAALAITVGALAARFAAESDSPLPGYPAPSPTSSDGTRPPP